MGTAEYLRPTYTLDWTLIELVGPSPGDDLNIDYPFVEECPLGTETTRPVTEMRARLNAYVSV
jgi:hypothetical protein